MKVFFAKWVPYCSVAFTDEWRRIAKLDFDSDAALIDQQVVMLRFWKDNVGRWARYRRESNGYTYAVDADDVVIVSEDWLRECSPEFEMEGSNE